MPAASTECQRSGLRPASRHSSISRKARRRSPSETRPDLLIRCSFRLTLISHLNVRSYGRLGGIVGDIDILLQSRPENPPGEGPRGEGASSSAPREVRDAAQGCPSIIGRMSRPIGDRFIRRPGAVVAAVTVLCGRMQIYLTGRRAPCPSATASWRAEDLRHDQQWSATLFCRTNFRQRHETISRADGHRRERGGQIHGIDGLGSGHLDLYSQLDQTSGLHRTKTHATGSRPERARLWRRRDALCGEPGLERRQPDLHGEHQRRDGHGLDEDRRVRELHVVG